MAHRTRLLTDHDYQRIINAATWQDLFEVGVDVSASDDAAHTRARRTRNMLARLAHPDRFPGATDTSREHEATTVINAFWEQAREFFSPAPGPVAPQEETEGVSVPIADALPHRRRAGVLSIEAMPPQRRARVDRPPTIAPGGCLALLEQSIQAQPPTLLKSSRGDTFVGFGNLETLQGCRFHPMSTNRCISPDVVAQRVTQNLRQLRTCGSYFDFGQISVVAVRSPASEQFVEETVEEGGARRQRRLARFYVLDGQHRLMTMVELARERPNVPIPFELSVKVVESKQAANEALMHMQHSYRPDPKCFFALDHQAEVASQALDLAKLRWPKAFVATHTLSFASKVRRVDRPMLHDGLFFDFIRDSHLLRRHLAAFHTPLVPDEDAYAYSSTYADESPGCGHARGWLDSPQGWSAKALLRGEWLRMDLGSVTQVAGVVTQPRTLSTQRVTRFRVQVSSDGVTWLFVGPTGATQRQADSAVFDGNTAADGADGKVEAYFGEQVSARFVKVVVEAWEGHISMRAAVLVADGSQNAARAAGLFADLVLVNATLKRRAPQMVAERPPRLSLAKKTVTERCGERGLGCWLGLYHRDKTEDARAILDMLREEGVVPDSAEVPDEDA